LGGEGKHSHISPEKILEMVDQWKNAFGTKERPETQKPFDANIPLALVTGIILGTAQAPSLPDTGLADTRGTGKGDMVGLLQKLPYEMFAASLGIEVTSLKEALNKVFSEILTDPEVKATIDRIAAEIKANQEQVSGDQRGGALKEEPK